MQYKNAYSTIKFYVHKDDRRSTIGLVPTQEVLQPSTSKDNVWLSSSDPLNNNANVLNSNNMRFTTKITNKKDIHGVNLLRSKLLQI